MYINACTAVKLWRSCDLRCIIIQPKVHVYVRLRFSFHLLVILAYAWYKSVKFVGKSIHSTGFWLIKSIADHSNSSVGSVRLPDWRLSRIQSMACVIRFFAAKNALYLHFKSRCDHLLAKNGLELVMTPRRLVRITGHHCIPKILLKLL